MLEVQNLHFGYDASLLRGIDLHVPAGKAAFILGPSGCGKSTMLRCIAGLLDAEGQVLVAGTPVAPLPTHKRSIGMLFQEPALFPHLNVWQNVAFGLKYRGIPRKERRPEAERWLAMVGLETKAEAHVDALSGGQRQRVALARTLAAKPKVVLLDEPFSALDRALRDDLGLRVKQLLAEQGVASVWVTHDGQEAATLGDSVWQLRDGLLQ